jgi:hypothetical protein
MSPKDYAAILADPNRKHRDPSATLTDFARIKFEKTKPSALYDGGNDPMGLFIDENGSVIAIIPADGDDNSSSCYQFTGQHSEISIDYAIDKLTSIDPANAKHMMEAADLVLELIGYGYLPVITSTNKFNTPQDWDQFIANAIDIREW